MNLEIKRTTPIESIGRPLEKSGILYICRLDPYGKDILRVIIGDRVYGPYHNGEWMDRGGAHICYHHIRPVSTLTAQE